MTTKRRTRNVSECLYPLVVVRDEKKAFIRSKYESRRYAIVTCADVEDRRQDLKQAIQSRDIHALIQVFAEGIDFMQPLPDTVNEPFNPFLFFGWLLNK